MNKKKKFAKIAQDIKSIKIQGARNVAKQALYAYSLIPTKQSKKILMSLRPTEPMLFNVLKRIEFQSYQEILNHFEEAQKRINQEILKIVKIDGNKKTAELKTEEIQKLRELIEKKYRVEGDLRRDLMMNIKRLKEIGSWRGSRHSKGLPTRGQRTKTNNRTVRGNVRKTVGSGKRAAPAPK